ncbi:MAG: hypothetical protein GY898_05345 [Proteobacteria bacterium]|nr:hypothetical protein [Pseudomonadota bacterium]
MITAITGLIGLLIAIVVPGVLTVQLLDDGDPLWRITVGLGVGLLAVPIPAFLIAMALGTSVTMPLLLVLGVVVSGGLLFALSRREGPESSQ